MDNLNRNELEVLRVLWDEQELKPAEIEKRFGWAIDNGTLRSVLKVLMEKGHLTRKKSGKVFLYRAKRSRKGVLSKVAKSMADAFSGGSTVGLIAQLIESEKLSAEELHELRRIADGKSNGGAS
jgi:BlaI family penicillinase repressor